MKMNGEYLCELVRAHYDGDDARFNAILQQIIGSETRKGSSEVAGRLQSILANHVPVPAVVAVEGNQP